MVNKASSLVTINASVKGMHASNSAGLLSAALHNFSKMTKPSECPAARQRLAPRAPGPRSVAKALPCTFHACPAQPQLASSQVVVGRDGSCAAAAAAGTTPSLGGGGSGSAPGAKKPVSVSVSVHKRSEGEVLAGDAADDTKGGADRAKAAHFQTATPSQ